MTSAIALIFVKFLPVIPPVVGVVVGTPPTPLDTGMDGAGIEGTGIDGDGVGVIWCDGLGVMVVWVVGSHDATDKLPRTIMR